MIYHEFILDENARAFSYSKPTQPENPRSLSIAMVGAPNAGKSTIVNYLVKDKVSIFAAN